MKISISLARTIICGLTFTGLFASAQAFAHPGHDPAMGHLKFAQGKIHAHLHWITAPPAENAKLRLEWHDGATHAALEPEGTTTVSVATGKTVKDAEVKSTPDAKDDKGQTEVGVYEVSQIHLSKIGPGTEVRVTLKLKDAPAETQSWKIDAAKE